MNPMHSTGRLAVTLGYLGFATHGEPVEDNEPHA
jgi:hypothetical protein